MPVELLRPPALRPGDRVAVVSPAWGGPADLPEPYRRGLEAMRSAGFGLRVMPHAEARRNDWVSATAAERAADLMTAFADPDVRGIVCTIGGNHSAQLLPHLDLDVIRTHPTVLCGYSDITTVLQGLHARTGLVGMYGPAVIPQWGAVGGVLPYVADHFASVTGRVEAAGALPRVGYEVHDDDFDRAEATETPLRQSPAVPREPLRAGRAEGPLLAGCLPSCRHLIGTPWQPDYTGRVLVLETPEPPYQLEDADADLTHLRLAGCLDNLAALVLCRPYRWDAATTSAFHDVAMDHVRGLDYPVLARVEGGHTDPLPTYPIGVRTFVDASAAEIVFTEAAVA